MRGSCATPGAQSTTRAAGCGSPKIRTGSFSRSSCRSRLRDLGEVEGKLVRLHLALLSEGVDATPADARIERQQPATGGNVLERTAKWVIPDRLHVDLAERRSEQPEHGR